MPKQTYAEVYNSLKDRFPSGQAPGGIAIHDLVRIKMQSTYATHLDIAREMATKVRKDMAAYDADHSKFTQSLGCWSGFHAQQMLKSVRRMKGNNANVYVYLSGWMIAAMRNRFGPLPDQSMHEKSAVPDLINEIYTSLRQADEVELCDLFERLKCARENGSSDEVVNGIISEIDNFESHVVPIVADIDAGFGNVHATFLLAKDMMRAGASIIQIENQVSDAKQCGHQDGKVTVPRMVFIEKIRAVRMAFEELGIHDGVIVARTDSLGASLTATVPVSTQSGDLAAQYNKWLLTEEINEANPAVDGELLMMQGGKLVRPVRLPNGLFKFKPNTGRDRVIEDCIANLNEGGADLLWIETPTPDVQFMSSMMEEIRKAAPHAKLVYNNSPSFNWTLNIRNKVKADFVSAGKCKEEDYPDVMAKEVDGTDLGKEADRIIREFQPNNSEKSHVFHNLITLPTFHMDAKSMDDLSRGYFGDDKMLAYVLNIQREEIYNKVSAVKHQHEVGSQIGDAFKVMSNGEERALKALGAANTMNQF